MTAPPDPPLTDGVVTLRLFCEDDVPAIVEGALKQQRLLAIAPREPTESDLRHIVTASMRHW